MIELQLRLNPDISWAWTPLEARCNRIVGRPDYGAWRDVAGFQACFARGRAETLHLLLDSGAEVNARIAGGMSALALARQTNEDDLAEILLAARAEE